MTTGGWTERLRTGLWRDNPGLVQLLGLCPLLAVTSTFVNGLLRPSDSSSRGVRWQSDGDVSDVFDNVMEKLGPLEGEPLLQATMMAELGALQSKRGDLGRAVSLLEEAVDRLGRLKGADDPALLTAQSRCPQAERVCSIRPTT